MIVLVCGGRDYADEAYVFDTLDSFNRSWPITMLVHGAARGADSLAAFWADQRKVPHTRDRFAAAWDDLQAPGARVKTNSRGKLYNANAGKDRNQRMLDEMKPEVCIAFPGGYGTDDMKTRARAAGLQIIEAA